MQNNGTDTITQRETAISIDTYRCKIVIDYTFYSIQWEPTITALLVAKGLIRGAKNRYQLIFWEQAGHSSLDLLTIGRKAQKQLCNLSKHSVALTLVSDQQQQSTSSLSTKLNGAQDLCA